ncbi:DNA topoisomerase 3-alpha-like [Planoprotostelium fungivorum]|uniref:DNA topoisomerase n=1 Tax=Planoprotostelium fungivorum TaxID=1890364 RepID=A0A2P6NHX5_9EUKA|nr:DNA topoisomerase 3-alpha-like [Planoprotostelium fungivorum]
MVFALNVAEKPSVAKGVTEILAHGNQRRRNGIGKYNPVWEFDSRVNGENVVMKFTSVSGHLMGSDFVGEYKGWNSCDPVDLFHAPIERFTAANMEDIEKNLQRESRGAKYLVLWLDCDREGENIAFEVMSVCLKINPNMIVLRAHFSSLNERDIYRAMETLTPPNELDSLAVETRMELDLRIGAAFTRYLTLRYQPKFEGLQDSLISYGPCQFPTLGFVVDRYWKIQNFLVEDFWTIQCTVELEGSYADFNWSRIRLYDSMCTLSIYLNCMDDLKATVTSVDAQPKRKYRPFPMTTVELQKQAARKLRISSDETMKIAEKLYQAGWISYPRTETDVFQDGTDFQSLIQMQTNDPGWGQYATDLLDQDKFLPPKKGKSNDNSHPPIHPTKYTTGLNGREKELYTYIVRHFLACCSKDAIGQETTVTIDIAGEKFTTKGLMVQETNWLDVFPYEKWTDRSIPNFKEGTTFVPTSFEVHQGQTVPPSLLSEAELITMMHENGIGTDATIAQHIQTIQNRGYAEKDKAALFVPTTLGVALVGGYNAIGLELSKPELRAETERDMVAISRGTKTKEQVLQSALDAYQRIFMQAIERAATMDEAFKKYFNVQGTQFDEETRNFSACGKCNGKMSIRSKGDRTRVLFCATCTSSYPLPPMGQVTPLDQRCPLCNFQPEKSLYSICPYCRNHPPADQVDPDKMSRPFNCFMCAAKCPLAKKQNDKPVRLCPLCKTSQMVLRKKKDGGVFLGCKGYPACNHAIWLPQGCVSATVTDTVCRVCHPSPIHHLRMEFLPTSSIATTYDTDQLTGCIGGCDKVLSDLLEQNNKGPLYTTTRDRASPAPAPKNSLPPPSKSQGGTSSTTFNGGTLNYNTINHSNRHTNHTTNHATNPSTTKRHAPVEYEEEEPTVKKRPNNHSYGNPPPSRDAGNNSCFSCGQPGHFSSNCPNKKGGNSGGNSYSGKSNSNGNHDDDGEEVLCPGHQEPCVKRTVNREGDNKGRKFWVCAKPQGEQCPNSFKWADEESTRGNGNFSKSSKTSDFSSSGGGASGACFNCNKPGHYSSNCPEKNNNGGRSYSGSGKTGGFGSGNNNNNSSSGSCYKCGQPGHFANNCPEGGSNSNSGRGDYSSGKKFGGKSNGPSAMPGRPQFSPQKPKSESGGGRKCSNCGQTGHNKRNCPNG